MLPLAQIPPPPFSGLELGPLNLRMYGLVIAIGAFLGLRMVVARYADTGGDPELAEKAALIVLGTGFLGGRIGYIIPRFLWDGTHGAAYIGRPLDILAIWQGGLAFFGGLVGGTLGVIIYLRVKKVALPAFADAVAPAVPLAQAFGRWGNYFNEELFGRPSDLPWALEVSSGPAERAGYPAASTFHPTFLYESLWNLGLVGVILWIDRRGLLRRRGSLIFIYLIGYGIGRGWIEALRVDTFQRYVGLSRNNWIAILVVIIGAVGLWWWETRGTGALLRDPDGATDTDDVTAEGSGGSSTVSTVDGGDTRPAGRKADIRGDAMTEAGVDTEAEAGVETDADNRADSDADSDADSGVDDHDTGSRRPD